MKPAKGYSVYARKGRPRWYICFLSAETGDWKDEVTAFRCDDPQGKNKALRLAEKKAEEFMRTATGRTKEAWGAWVPKMLKAKYGRSPRTLSRYQAAWDKVREFLHEKKVTTPNHLSYQHVVDYMAWRTAQRRNRGTLISRNTSIFEVKFLSLCMQEAVRRGFALSNPCASAGLRRDKAKEKAELKPEEIEKIRRVVAEKEKTLPIGQRWMSTSFEIALHQGCRLMETGVPMEDISLEKGTITFRAKGYNGEPHIFTTALHPGLRPLITELNEAGATHTCTLPKMAGRIWWRLRKANGLEHTCFHATRVTVVTRLARAGVPIQQAMRFVGHSSTIVHRIYQKLAAEDLHLCTEALTFSPAKPDTKGAP